MKVDLPAYPEYRCYSGSFFGLAPDSWRVIRLKFIMPEVTVGLVITPSKYYVDDGVPAVRSLNVREGILVDDDLVYFSKEDNEKLFKTKIYKDDVVIVRTGQTGACAVVDDRFNGANCIDLIIVRKSRYLRSRFLYYFLSSGEVVAEITINSNGAIQQHFNIRLVRELEVLQPSLSEQDAIVAFLHRETAKIDRLAEVRRKQIECLQEQRTAVIHHAVTKGLDPAAQMKPSGVEWLGDIPENWQINKLRYVVNFRGGGTPSKGISAYWQGDIPWVSPKDMKSLEIFDAEDHITNEALADSASSLVPKGCVLIVVRSGILRHSIPVAINMKEVALNQDMKALQVQKCLNTKYLMFLIMGHEEQLLTLWRKQGSTVESLEHHLIANTYVAIPDIDEQMDIVSHIDSETAKLDTLIFKYHRELELLAEYRASLISHAVTGKIDVRGLVELESNPASETLRLTNRDYHAL